MFWVLQDSSVILTIMVREGKSLNSQFPFYRAITGHCQKISSSASRAGVEREKNTRDRESPERGRGKGSRSQAGLFPSPFGQQKDSPLGKVTFQREQSQNSPRAPVLWLRGSCSNSSLQEWFSRAHPNPSRIPDESQKSIPVPAQQPEGGIAELVASKCQQTASASTWLGRSLRKSLEKPPESRDSFVTAAAAAQGFPEGQKAAEPGAVPSSDPQFPSQVQHCSPTDPSRCHCHPLGTWGHTQSAAQLLELQEKSHGILPPGICSPGWLFPGAGSKLGMLEALRCSWIVAHVV